MLGHGILKYFCPITHKKDAPEDKDPPEGKQLSQSIWAIFIEKLYPHRHRDQLPAVTLMSPGC